MRQGRWSVYDPRQQAGVGDDVPSLQIVCAWCQESLRRQRVQTPTRFPISYSICGRCYGVAYLSAADHSTSPRIEYNALVIPQCKGALP